MKSLNFDLAGMPHAEKAMQRIDAWYDRQIIDRVPVRFSKHNEQYETAVAFRPDARWATLADRWMDAEYQVDNYLSSIEGKRFDAETFPEFWPNLGPEIYAAIFGAELGFGEVTSWSLPLIHDLESFENFDSLVIDADNKYLAKIREMTAIALEKCKGKALVGMTCWGPGIDCAAAWLEPQELAVNLLMEGEKVKKLLDRSLEPFQTLYDESYNAAANAGYPSIGWMGIPNFGKGHIVQADFSNMISSELFDEFCLPWIKKEIEPMDRVIFHLDGKGVARHLDRILALDKVDAIQWVQGVGDDEPILQWTPLIRKIQETGKSAVVDLKASELEGLIGELDPEGLFLCVACDEADHSDILKRIEKW